MVTVKSSCRERYIGQVASILRSSASSYTIDDSQWGTSALSLTSGWNMLRQGGALEYINATQAAIMQPLLSNWWNQSISWTTTGGSAVTLNFSGGCPVEDSIKDPFVLLAGQSTSV